MAPSDPCGAPRPISPILLVLFALSAVSFVTSNVVAVKVVSIAGQYVPGGVVVFPLAFLVDDIIVEVYGYRSARQAIWLGFCANLFFVVAVELVLVLPPAPFWEAQRAYETILGSSWRLLLASFCSYLVGSFANAVVMSRMKVAMDGRWLGVRTIGSTIVGQGLDTLIFVSVGFAGTVPAGSLRRIIVTAWAMKCLYEVVLTPVVYLLIRHIKAVEQLDTYDIDVDYSPLALGDR